MQRFVFILLFVVIGECVFVWSKLFELNIWIIFYIYFFLALASVAMAGYFPICSPPCQTGGHVPTCCRNHGFSTGRCVRTGRGNIVGYCYWTVRRYWLLMREKWAWTLLYFVPFASCLSLRESFCFPYKLCSSFLFTFII